MPMADLTHDQIAELRAALKGRALESGARVIDTSALVDLFRQHAPALLAAAEAGPRGLATGTGGDEVMGAIGLLALWMAAFIGLPALAGWLAGRPVRIEGRRPPGLAVDVRTNRWVFTDGEGRSALPPAKAEEGGT
jgi:hypothetical protein